MSSLSPYHATFLPYLAAGLAAGVLVVGWGGLRNLLVVRLASLLVGIVLIWGALVLAVGRGFEAWKQSPNPPEQVFSDGGPMIGALFLGWIPASVVCGLVYLLAKRRRVSARSAA